MGTMRPRSGIVATPAVAMPAELVAVTGVELEATGKVVAAEIVHQLATTNQFVDIQDKNAPVKKIHRRHTNVKFICIA
jgi:hypothetical protein